VLRQSLALCQGGCSHSPSKAVICRPLAQSRRALGVMLLETRPHPACSLPAWSILLFPTPQLHLLCLLFTSSCFLSYDGGRPSLHTAAWGERGEQATWSSLGLSAGSMVPSCTAGPAG
jgi:hypothetical protein